MLLIVELTAAESCRSPSISTTNSELVVTCDSISSMIIGAKDDYHMAASTAIGLNKF